MLYPLLLQPGEPGPPLVPPAETERERELVRARQRAVIMICDSRGLMHDMLARARCGGGGGQMPGYCSSPSDRREALMSQAGVW